MKVCIQGGKLPRERKGEKRLLRLTCETSKFTAGEDYLRVTRAKKRGTRRGRRQEVEEIGI